LPDTSPSAVKTGSVQVKYADGTERTLPIHGLSELKLFVLMDELGFKHISELTCDEMTVQKIRFMLRAVAEALTFEKTQDVWTLDRIQQAFADVEQIAKAFTLCIEFSNLRRAPADFKPQPKGRSGTYV